MPLLAAMPGLSAVILRRTKVTRVGLMELAAHPTLAVAAEDLFSEADMAEFELAQRRLANRTSPSPLIGCRPTLKLRPPSFRPSSRPCWRGSARWMHWIRRPTRQWNGTRRRAEELFDEYCTAKDRKYGRPNVLWSDSEYAKLRLLNTQWLTPRKVFFYAKGGDLDAQYRFLVVKRGARWLVNHKEVRGDGWETGVPVKARHGQR